MYADGETNLFYILFVMGSLGKIFGKVALMAIAALWAACSEDSVSEPSDADVVLSSAGASFVAEGSSSSQTPNSSETFAEPGALAIATTVAQDTLELFNFGGVPLDFAADSFLTKFDYGDIVTLMIDGYDTLDVPVTANFNDVTVGEFFLYASGGTNNVMLELSYGQAAEAFGITRGAKFPINAAVQLKEKSGYLAYWAMSENILMSGDPEMYPGLSIEEFANFRMVKTRGMGEGVLYRSSSPVDPALARNTYADSLSKVAGVATFVNLANSEEGAASFTGFAESYYATQNVVYLELQPSFANTSFKEGLVQGFRYIADHDGPYLVHCTYGMDRTGFTIAVLEALMGATASEIKDDYAQTHKNFYLYSKDGYSPLTVEHLDLYKKIIAKNLQAAYNLVDVDISDFENADLAAATEKYLLAIGMQKSEIAALKKRLSAP